jgi:hypothetical protein
MRESDIETLPIDRDRFWQWAVENGKKINPNKSKAVSFTRTVVKDPLNYVFRDQRIPEANNYKYLGIIQRFKLG